MNRNRPERRSRVVPTALLAALATTVTALSPAFAADGIRVGRLPGVSLFYLPTYVAADKGFFAEEGLDVTFVKPEPRRPLTAQGISGAIDFVPDTGGARVSIKGAPVRFVVGQSHISRWVMVANPESAKSVRNLKGKTIAMGNRDTENYREATFIFQRIFGMREGRDYRVARIPSEAKRLAALVDGKVQGAAMSYLEAAKAGVEGFAIVLKPGHYIPRAEGAYWVRAEFLEKNRDKVRRFIRAIAKATLYLSTDQIGSIELIQKYFGITSPAEANVLWNSVHRDFDPGITADLLRQAFEENLVMLRRKGLWPVHKPMPEVEQFVASGVIKNALRELGY